MRKFLDTNLKKKSKIKSKIKVIENFTTKKISGKKYLKIKKSDLVPIKISKNKKFLKKNFLNKAPKKS